MTERIPIQFLLNEREMAVQEPAGLLVLDFLRRRQHLTGTKEGCKEGDCGACGVLVGAFDEVGRLDYRPVTSCLMPLGELHGKHLVTIEGLNLPSGLTPLQEAIVLEGGTQCGYCTPGIVVSMTHCLMQRRSAATLDDMKLALSGHLCRCTGYGSLKRAGAAMADLWNKEDRAAEDGRLESQLGRLVDKGILPSYFAQIPERLRALQQRLSAGLTDSAQPAFRIAGGTDLYVQRGEEIPDVPVDVLNHHAEWCGVSRNNGTLEVGALTTFEALSHDPVFRAVVPRIGEFMHLIASLQIRNRATLSGNVVNASPIGDMTMLLLALEADITLQRGDTERRLPLRHLYQGYKSLAKEPDEVLTRFSIPVPGETMRVNFEKVSKRECLDIASVNSAIKLTLRDGLITGASLAAGGVAPIPKYLPKSSALLVGREPGEALVRELLRQVQQEVSPISDVRGSAEYKRLLLRQLVIAHFVKLFPELIRPESFAAGAQGASAL